MDNMIEVKLTKVSINSNALRTNEVLGKCDLLPELGKPFVIYAEGIEFGIRMVTTSLVQEITETGSQIVFKTLNSEYKLERIAPIA